MLEEFHCQSLLPKSSGNWVRPGDLISLLSMQFQQFVRYDVDDGTKRIHSFCGKPFPSEEHPSCHCFYRPNAQAADHALRTLSSG